MQMDVVVISEHTESEVKKLAAVQEDGRLALLSVWTTEPVFGDSLEFLVAEEDLFPGFDPAEVILHSIIPETALSYGSRQVGGGTNYGTHVFSIFFVHDSSNLILFFRFFKEKDQVIRTAKKARGFTSLIKSCCKISRLLFDRSWKLLGKSRR